MGNYIVDFMYVTLKLIVEADGGQHTEQAAYDHVRMAYLNKLGFTVLRFWNHEIVQQTNNVLAEILRVLQELEKQSTQFVFLAELLAPTAASSSLTWERTRKRAISRKVCIGEVKEFGKDFHHSGDALSPPLPM